MNHLHKLFLTATWLLFLYAFTSTSFAQTVSLSTNAANIGENGGQEVQHLHFHVLGGAKLAWGHFSDSDPKSNL